MTDSLDRANYWANVHSSKQFDDVSWWQDEESVWVDVIVDLGLPNNASIVDVGAGSSVMVDVLAARGYNTLTAIDIAAEPLDRIRERIGDRVELETIVADITKLGHIGNFDLWHDRAVFHFLTQPEDQAAYKEALLANTHGGSFAIISTFAEDGPEQCSGLPVQRYTPEELAQEFAPEFEPIQVNRRVHATPWASEQSFTQVVLRRNNE